MFIREEGERGGVSTAYQTGYSFSQTKMQVDKWKCAVCLRENDLVRPFVCSGCGETSMWCLVNSQLMDVLVTLAKNKIIGKEAEIFIPTQTNKKTEIQSYSLFAFPPAFPPLLTQLEDAKDAPDEEKTTEEDLEWEWECWQCALCGHLDNSSPDASCPNCDASLDQRGVKPPKRPKHPKHEKHHSQPTQLMDLVTKPKARRSRNKKKKLPPFHANQESWISDDFINAFNQRYLDKEKHQKESPVQKKEETNNPNRPKNRRNLNWNKKRDRVTSWTCPLCYTRNVKTLGSTRCKQCKTDSYHKAAQDRLVSVKSVGF